MMNCAYFPQCQACTRWDISYEQQAQLKKNHLLSLINRLEIGFGGEIEFLSAGKHSLRNRADFSVAWSKIHNAHLFGFFDKNKSLVDVKSCLQMSPELQVSFEKFCSLKPFVKESPVEKMSVRLRVSPANETGCWLDLANKDIKSLLDDGQYLQNLLDLGFKIEMGQKSKTVETVSGRIKLVEPTRQQWFRTYSASGDPKDLYCHISDFTQPSWITGKLIIDTISKWLTPTKNEKLFEFGAGIGFFTHLFLNLGYQVTCGEISPECEQALRLNFKEAFVDESLTIEIADFYKRQLTQDYAVVFVNPARSGLKEFSNTLLERTPNKIIYVSCFPDSMIKDLELLSEVYKISAVKIVDQFPQTDHYEVCMLLEKC